MNVQLLTMRELDHRMNEGIHVRLLWCEEAGRLAVSVVDSRTGAAFAVDVRADESARDVFDHPYAYAAWHGVDTTGARSAETPAHELAA